MASPALQCCPQGSSDKGEGSCGLAGSQCPRAPRQARCTCWQPAWFPSSPSDSWGHMPFTGAFATHLDVKYFPLSLLVTLDFRSTGQVPNASPKGSIRYAFRSFSCCKLTPHRLFSGALSYLYLGINTRFIDQFHSLFWIPAQVYMIQAKPGGR